MAIYKNNTYIFVFKLLGHCLHLQPVSLVIVEGVIGVDHRGWGLDGGLALNLGNIIFNTIIGCTNAAIKMCLIKIHTPLIK